MSRYWKAALPFLLAAVIILAAASRPVVLHIGFPCDSYWNVPGENYYTFIDAAIEKFEAEHPNVKVEYTGGIAGRSRQGETVCAAAGMRAADDVHQ